MHLKPLGNKVAVKLIKEEEKTTAGILMPSNENKNKRQEGIVIAIGNGEEVYKLGLQIDDKVIFGQYQGEEVEDGEDKYKILNHDAVLAVIN